MHVQRADQPAAIRDQQAVDPPRLLDLRGFSREPASFDRGRIARHHLRNADCTHIDIAVERTAQVAVDFVGAGNGETVIVTTGSSARMTTSKEHSVIDAAVVGIVDSLDLNGQ